MNYELNDDYLNYVDSFIDKTDEEKIEAIKRAKEMFPKVLYEYILVNIAKTFDSDQLKLSFIKENIDIQDIMDVVISIKNDLLKSGFIELFENDDKKLEIIASFNDDNEKIKYLSLFENDFAKSLIIKSLKTDELKEKYLSCIKNDDFISAVICSFKNEELKLKYLKIIPVLGIKREILRFIKDNKLKKEAEEHITDFNNNFFHLIKGQEIYEESNFERLKENIQVPIFEEGLLPNALTIGVEIELAFGLSDVIKRYADFPFYKKPFNRWNLKNEIVLPNNSVEVTSPVLNYTVNDIKELYLVCDFLKQNNLQAIDSSGHIHIGVNVVESAMSLKTLYELYSIMEKEIYLMSNEKGTLPRIKVKEYAKPISKNVEEAIEKGHFNVSNAEELDFFIEQIGFFVQRSTIHSEGDKRYYGINIMNLLRPHNNLDTIEFRIPNVSLNPDVIHQNIKFFSRLILLSNELCKENRQNEVLEIIKTLKDEEKVLYFLKLLFKEEKNRSYFFDRYIQNKTLEEESKFFNDDDFGTFIKR